jgi:hypothetical protein
LHVKSSVPIIVAGAALIVEIGASLLLPRFTPALAVAIGACACLSLATFFAVFRGLDATWRQPK